MALVDIRLALLTFPQRWTGTSIEASLLVMPSGDPTAPLFPTAAGTAAFAGTPIALRAAAVAGLDSMPSLPAVSAAVTLPAPTNAGALFAELAARFSPTDQMAGPPPPVPPQSTLLKALPDSYVALRPAGSSPSPYVRSTDEFGCTVRGQEPAPPPTTRPDPSWGEVISYALRNPALATALGLRYSFSLPVADPTPFAGGGWLFVTLDPADGGSGYAAAWAATPDAVKLYAARLPPLATPPRALFAAVLFPVTNPAAPPSVPDQSAVDEAIIEAEAYDDGFAKLVHARQPDTTDAHVGDGKTNVNPATDVGIQVGWDDEQILTWHNRQTDLAHRALTGDPVPLESPLGVQGYRLDVREPAPGETPAQRDDGWVSLMLATGTPPPPLDQLVGEFAGELVVEPTASAPAAAGARPAQFWLPLYFAQWRGGPLGVRDDTPHLLSGGVAAGLASPVVPSAFLGADVPALVYGRRYETRVRLGDQSGGGPLVTDRPVNETTAERAAVDFARYVSPNAFGVTTTAPVDEIVLRRPVIGYPEALFTARYGSRPEVRDAARSAMLAQLGLGPDGSPLPAGDRVPDSLTVGVPDPDVSEVEIRVEVRTLSHDAGDDLSPDGLFHTLYVTTRPIAPLAALPAGAVTPAQAAADTAIDPLPLEFRDVDVVDANPSLVPPAAGPLPVPTARDVRIVLTPIASGPAGYFGSVDPAAGRPQPTRGVSSHLILRRAPGPEPTPLLVPLPGGRPPLEALWFRPSPSGDPVSALMDELADQLDLVADGLTLHAPPGTRVAFGSAANLACTIGPDGASLTFSAVADLYRRWTVALRYDLARDWTWDALTGGQVGVTRGGQPVGAVTVGRVASADALSGTPDRSRTRLVFFDVVDPAVPDPVDGHTPRPPYAMIAVVDDGGAGTTSGTDPVALRLPVVVAPSGTPKLVSAGYALSPYQPSSDYASTAPRTRQLWVEIAEPPATGDALFARVLAYAPDPLLYVDRDVLAAEPPPEPELSLDPELVRRITPDQPRDDDGLTAMTPLPASPSEPTKFLLPVPDGVAPDDPRLFGMWTYEFRFGHVEPWSTAHGRFGRPLRVTGIAHPAPQAPCASAWLAVPTPGVRRLEYDLVATAPYAVPVLHGHQVGDGIPRSVIAFLLYAQCHQSDGSGNRNVLIAHQPDQTGLLVARHHARAAFSRQVIGGTLAGFGLPPDTALSVLAVEFYYGGGAIATGYSDPVIGGAGPRDRDDVVFDPFDPIHFGTQRILRTSPLTPVQPFC